MRRSTPFQGQRTGCLHRASSNPNSCRFAVVSPPRHRENRTSGDDLWGEPNSRNI